VVKKMAEKINYYTETNEIEIVKGDDYLVYFENLDEFVAFIKTSPRLYEELKAKLEGE
jgi:hypothetical protein